MKFSDKLRSDAGEQRQAAAVMLKAITEGPSAIRDQLLAAASITNIDAMRAEVNRIAETVSSGAAEKRSITAVTGVVTANVMDLVADLADYFVASGALKRVAERLKEHRAFNHAIQMAAAQGNWDEFDRVVNQLAESGTNNAEVGEGSGGD